MRKFKCIFMLGALALLALTISSAQEVKNQAAPQAVTIQAALTPLEIDHLIRVEWNREGIVPAPRADDARFLRRVYLDIVGALPPPAAITAFLNDSSGDKREKVVDSLLDSPQYADHWTNYWDSVLMGRALRNQLVDRSEFRRWLHTQFAQDVHWDKFVYSLITATGINSTGGNARKKVVGMMSSDDDAGDGNINPKLVNGAVNWVLRYGRQSPADLSGTASKVFLGVQIQCAQCHDHKTEKWKQSDFRSFTACFIQARPAPVEKYQKGQMRVLELRDVNRPMRYGRGKKALARNTELALYADMPPRALDGTDFSDSANRRQALAAWMTGKDNPWFAEAIVNRMWAHFLGRGIVEPIDDFRPSNPPIMPDLLKKLSDDFKMHDYDLKRLIRLICATQVYQLSSAHTPRAVDPTNRYWERYRLKPMGPDELMDSLVSATNVGPVLERVAGANLDLVKFRLHQQFTFLFDVDEEFEQKEFEGTISQALMLLNGPVVNRSITPIPGTTLSETLAMSGGDNKKIEALYLRTLSREPTPTELKKWTAFVNAPRVAVETEDSAPPLRPAQYMNKQQGKKGKRAGGNIDPLARASRRMSLYQTPKQQAYEDLFWALLNSSEFIFNH